MGFSSIKVHDVLKNNLQQAMLKFPAVESYALQVKPIIDACLCSYWVAAAAILPSAWLACSELTKFSVDGSECNGSLLAAGVLAKARETEDLDAAREAVGGGPGEGDREGDCVIDEECVEGDLAGEADFNGALGGEEEGGRGVEDVVGDGDLAGVGGEGVGVGDRKRAVASKGLNTTSKVLE